MKIARILCGFFASALIIIAAPMSSANATVWTKIFSGAGTYTWTVPSNSANRVYVYGCNGSGGNGTPQASGGSGGSAAFALKYNALTAGQRVGITICGGPTAVTDTVSNATIASAADGSNANGVTHGIGGTTAIGDLVYFGHDGTDGVNGSNFAGAGAPSPATPAGNGQPGGVPNPFYAAGGGGGCGSPDSTPGQEGNGSYGGVGGLGMYGNGAGAGAGVNSPATQGSFCGGGGGGLYGNYTNGANGGCDFVFTDSWTFQMWGPCGGGGGASVDEDANAGSPGNGAGGSVNGNGGAGLTGAVIIVYSDIQVSVGDAFYTGLEDNIGMPVVFNNRTFGDCFLTNEYDCMTVNAGNTPTVTVGISSGDGGGIPYLSIHGFNTHAVPADMNLDAYGDGRNIDSSMRDDMHSGYFNPTQGGADFACGTPASLFNTYSNGYLSRVDIGEIAVPLFAHNEYDFQQWHGVCQGDFTGSDADGIDETDPLRFNEDMELRSGFHLGGVWEDATKTLGIPALKYDRFYAYYRDPTFYPGPGAIQQFCQTLINCCPNGIGCENVIDPTKEVAQFSIPGDAYRQLPEVYDLSSMGFAFGVRLLAAYFPFVVFHSTVNGAPTWIPQTLSSTSNIPNCNMYESATAFMYQGNLSMTNRTGCRIDGTRYNVDDDLVMLASNISNDVAGFDPAVSFAVAEWSPRDETYGQLNTAQCQIVDTATGNVEDNEDRLAQIASEAGYETGGQVSNYGDFVKLHILSLFTGMRSPTAFFDRGVDAREVCGATVYILFGTPDDIYRAVTSLRHRSRAMSPHKAGYKTWVKR